MHPQSLLFIFSNKHSLIKKKKKSPSVFKLVLKTAFNWCLNKAIHLSMRVFACIQQVYCMYIALLFL